MAEQTQTMASLLGGAKTFGKRPVTRDIIVEHIRRGLPASAVYAMSSGFDLPQDELLKLLKISRRTLTRRRDQRLTQAVSDRLARIARIIAMAVEVLGTKEAAIQWMNAPNRALGGRVPLASLDTDLGAEAVEAVLGRLEYGVYS